MDEVAVEEQRVEWRKERRAEQRNVDEVAEEEQREERRALGQLLRLLQGYAWLLWPRDARQLEEAAQHWARLHGEGRGRQ